MDNLKSIIKLMRPKHWLKNVLVFVSLVFDKNLFVLPILAKAVCGFMTFSFLSSAIYIFNDIQDVESDRKHEVKRNRPIAAGKIKIPVAYALCALCLVAAVGIYLAGCGFSIDGAAFCVLYFLVNLGYSLGLKHVPILDIVLLVSGFLLRVVFGAAIIDSSVSSWVYLTVIALSFYLGLGKRRNELNKAGSSGSTRKVLQFYTYAFLDKFMYLSLTLAIAFYALWSADEAIAVKYGTDKLIWTVPFVIVLMMKYSADIESGSYGDPVDVILHDKVLVILAALFGITLLGLIYVPGLL